MRRRTTISGDTARASRAGSSGIRHQAHPVVDARRIDFAHWLSRLPRRNRGIAIILGLGGTAQAVANRFRLSPGRISQLRKEFAENWRLLQGDDVAAAEPAPT